MRRAKRVIFAFRTTGETGQPVLLAQSADAVAPAGQDLVRIALMANIPDQPVMWRVEDVVDRDRQFHDAKACAQMTAGLRDGVDHFGANFIGQLRKTGIGQLAHISGDVDSVEQRRLWFHSCFPGRPIIPACLSCFSPDCDVGKAELTGLTPVWT